MELSKEEKLIAASINDLRSIDSSISQIMSFLDKARLPGAEKELNPSVFQKIIIARDNLNEAKTSFFK